MSVPEGTIPSASHNSPPIERPDRQKILFRFHRDIRRASSVAPGPQIGGSGRDGPSNDGRIECRGNWRYHNLFARVPRVLVSGKIVASSLEISLMKLEPIAAGFECKERQVGR